MTADYTVLSFSDGNGELFMGNTRSASYKYVAPDLTSIILSAAVGGGKEETRDGYCQQYEKAADVCRLWVEEGRVSSNFHDLDAAFAERYEASTDEVVDDTLIIDPPFREQFAARVAETRKRQGNES